MIPSSYADRDGERNGVRSSSPAQNVHEAWETLKARHKLAVSLVDGEPIVDLLVVDESWLFTQDESL